MVTFSSYYCKKNKAHRAQLSVPGWHGWCWAMNRTLNRRVPPAKLEPCPTATQTDIHANHNRNDRAAPLPPTTHPGRQSCQPAQPTEQTSPPEVPPLSLYRQTDWDKLGQSPPPPLPPTLPLHCALQQPLLRGLIPRSDHHLYLLCWHN